MGTLLIGFIITMTLILAFSVSAIFASIFSYKKVNNKRKGHGKAFKVGEKALSKEQENTNEMKQYDDQVKREEIANLSKEEKAKLKEEKARKEQAEKAKQQVLSKKQEKEAKKQAKQQAKEAKQQKQTQSTEVESDIDGEEVLQQAEKVQNKLIKDLEKDNKKLLKKQQKLNKQEEKLKKEQQKVEDAISNITNTNSNSQTSAVEETPVSVDEDEGLKKRIVRVTANVNDEALAKDQKEEKFVIPQVKQPIEEEEEKFVIPQIKETSLKDSKEKDKDSKEDISIDYLKQLMNKNSKKSSAFLDDLSEEKTK